MNSHYQLRRVGRRAARLNNVPKAHNQATTAEQVAVTDPWSGVTGWSAPAVAPSQSRPNQGGAS